MAKKEIVEEITTEIDGKEHSGKRKIIGTTTLDQVIAYKGKCLTDFKGYKSIERDKMMLGAAKQILAELVTGRTLSAKNSDKYGL